ncbi:MAG: HAMP domain-containing sensor histidine kinase [Oscillospiraceae bacterium]|nr:HAMP domain-containing sensor histidine kinase [Oscillospiraceae bacterium]
MERKMSRFTTLRKPVNRSGRRFSKDSIVYRWVFNNLAILILILFVIASIMVFAIQNYYYLSTEQYLTGKLTTITSVLSKYSTDTTKNFSSEVRNMVETFADKDKIELMAINSKGKVVITSSGFSPDDSVVMNDFDEAMETKTFGRWWGKTENNEKIMAVSYPISSKNSDYSAMRVVVSMSDVDDIIFSMSLIVIACCMFILLPLIFSGIYFVGSIVRPVQKVNGATKKFAMGNFTERIPIETNDEIGQLCESINHMADELSAAEAMKNEFISSVSHELRTPLTAIKGWAETISNDNDEETTRKGIRVIVSETERLSQMVEELLDFSRMQNGKFTLQMSKIDILAELEDAILIYTEKAKHENTQISYNSPEMLPFIIGDKNRLRQVFINIIDNAIKYSSSPDHESHISINAFQKDSKRICIAIEDNGCGISAADLPKIKTKFFKANHTKRGSGIGLAVADEIIMMHHGKLKIESQEGVGTTVYITLPTESSHKTI